jgi:hypothetical protein
MLASRVCAARPVGRRLRSGRRVVKRVHASYVRERIGLRRWRPCKLRADEPRHCALLGREQKKGVLAQGFAGDGTCDPGCLNRYCGAGCGKGETCGRCRTASSCNQQNGLCWGCGPQCSNKQCGWDGCARVCSSCSGNSKCDGGKCVPRFGCGTKCGGTAIATDGKVCSCGKDCATNSLISCCSDVATACK